VSAAGKLAEELRDRLGPAPTLGAAPLVSIVVANHDGAAHLRRLLAGLRERTDYPRLELIAVDNGSEDDSIELLRSTPLPFPVKILANAHNESFSDANNQGAAAARGELLLFLNNDVEPIESGWLRELVACLQGNGGGAAGATLVFPHEERDRFPCGFAVQHRGLRFREEEGTIGPVLHEWEADPLDEQLGRDIASPVVVAACLLVSADLFRRVGGFTHGYVYGAEDIDLCLKLRATGDPVVCSGRSVLVHLPGSTRRTIAFEAARARKLRNHRLLLEHWGPRLRREHDLDTFGGGAMWLQLGRERTPAASSRPQAKALGVCVRADPDGAGHAVDPCERLRAAVAARGGRCLILRGEEVEDPRGLELDLAIHLRGPRRYVPAAGQFNVLWLSRASGDVTGAECDDYDLVLGEDAAQAGHMRAVSSAAVAVAASAAEAIDAALAAAGASGRPTAIHPGRSDPSRPANLGALA